MDLLGHELLNSASAVGLFIRRSDQLERFTNAHRDLARHVVCGQLWCSAVLSKLPSATGWLIS